MILFEERALGGVFEVETYYFEQIRACTIFVEPIFLLGDVSQLFTEFFTMTCEKNRVLLFNLNSPLFPCDWRRKRTNCIGNTLNWKFIYYCTRFSKKIFFTISNYQKWLICIKYQYKRYVTQYTLLRIFLLQRTLSELWK